MRGRPHRSTFSRYTRCKIWERRCTTQPPSASSLGPSATARLGCFPGGHSDGQNVASLADSPKYLESKVGRSKTSFTLERKTRFLPMAARKVGIKHAWAAAWLEVMGETGVTVAQSNPLLPCPSSTSSWKMIPLPCDQAGSWLRSILRGTQHDPYLENVGTHSLKRTLLSWASKRGLPRDQRSLLGYHSSQSSGAGTGARG